MQLNAAIILKSTNEYYPKIISKSGRKMDLYPALILVHRDGNLARASIQNVISITTFMDFHKTF